MTTDMPIRGVCSDWCGLGVRVGTQRCQGWYMNSSFQTKNKVTVSISLKLLCSLAAQITATR